MSLGPIANLAGSYLQSIFSSSPVQKSTAANSTGALGSQSATSFASQSDNGQLSPFAQILSQLQQLQQSSPAQYQQVTQQIAGNLQSAAQTAQAQGNAGAAAQLTQLSTDFTNASQSGQLPNIQDLSQATGAAGGHHHHHHFHPPAQDQNTSLNSTASSSFNPANIIANTLSTAGMP
jgi:hypothetical protein